MALLNANKMPKPMTLSKANRSQLLTLDLTEAIVIALRKSKEEKKAQGKKQFFQSKTWRCLDRIANRISAIREKISGGPRPLLIQKDYDKYQKYIKQITKLMIDSNISDQYGFDPIESINAALCMVDDKERETALKQTATHKDWGMLHQSLFTLYTHIDNDISDYNRMRLGESLSHKIIQIAA